MYTHVHTYINIYVYEIHRFICHAKRLVGKQQRQDKVSAGEIEWNVVNAADLQFRCTDFHVTLLPISVPLPAVCFPAREGLGEGEAPLCLLNFLPNVCQHYADHAEQRIICIRL